MEMADGIVINKADGDNIGPAQLAQAQYRWRCTFSPDSVGMEA